MHLIALVALASLLAVGMVTTPVSRFVPTGYLSHVTLTGDANSYVTGGWVLTPATFGFVDSIDEVIAVVSGGAYVVQWIPATSALKVQTDPGTGLAEVGNGGSTAGLQVELYAFGR